MALISTRTVTPLIPSAPAPKVPTESDNTSMLDSKSHVEQILDAPVHKEEPPLTIPQTIDIATRSISDIITILDGLPKVNGSLPDKVVMAIGKLHGALVYLNK